MTASDEYQLVYSIDKPMALCGNDLTPDQLIKVNIQVLQQNWTVLTHPVQVMVSINRSFVGIQFYDENLNKLDVNGPRWLDTDINGRLTLYLSATQPNITNLMVAPPRSGARSRTVVFWGEVPVGGTTSNPPVFDGQVRIPGWDEAARNSLYGRAGFIREDDLASYGLGTLIAVVCNDELAELTVYEGGRRNFRVPYLDMATSTGAAANWVRYLVDDQLNPEVSPSLVFSAAGCALLMPDPGVHAAFGAPGYGHDIPGLPPATQLTNTDLTQWGGIDLIVDATDLDPTLQYTLRFYLNGYSGGRAVQKILEFPFFYSGEMTVDGLPGTIKLHYDKSHFSGFGALDKANRGYLYANYRSPDGQWSRPWGPIKIDFRAK